MAERWYELGEKEKAKTLFAEGLRLANQVPKRTEQHDKRGKFAARLARVDLPSALAIAKDFPRVVTIPQIGCSGTSRSTWRRTIPPRPNAF